MMKASEVASRLDVSKATIYRKAQSGEIPCYRIGNAIRFKIEEVEEAIKDAKKDRTESRSYSAL